MQAVTIFCPIYESFRSNRLSQSTLATLRKWEDRNAWEGSTLRSQSLNSGPSYDSEYSLSPESKNAKKHLLVTMAGLEHVLFNNPDPLLHFAATKDFTAENILFLIAVRDWRAAWATQNRSTLFNQAVQIYAHSVSEKLAEFPINIEGPIRSRLDTTFGPAVAELTSNRANEACPFSEPGVALDPLRKVASTVPVREPRSEPQGFDGHVFDAAETSIKYLVFTNTWRKYVNSTNNLRLSEETLT